MIVNKDLIREIELTQVSPSLVIAKGDKGDRMVYEIRKNASTLAYAVESLLNMAAAGYLFTFGSNLVIDLQAAENGCKFAVVNSISKGAAENDPHTVTVAYYKATTGGTNPEYTSLGSRYIPCKINGKYAGAGGILTLEASDISAANNWSPANDTDLATKKYVDDNAGIALIVTLTEENGDLVADGATPAEIYAAWTAGKPVFVKPSDSDFYVPLLSARYESDAYTFFAMATEAMSGSATVTTWYANYDENGWEVSSESVLGLPGVSSADAGKFLKVSALGGWELQTFPTIPAAQIQADWSQNDNTKLDYIKNKPAPVIGSTDSQAADYISPSDAIAAVSAGKTLVITHTDSVYSMGAVQFNSFVVRGGAAIVGMMAADNGSGVTLANLIGAGGSWSFSIYNIPGTGSVASGNAGYVTGGAVYTALQNAGVKEYTLTEELWDESKPYYFMNQNATDNPFVWLYATGDLTASGQPLHNAIITGVDVSTDGTNWTDLSADRDLDYQPIVPSKPWLIAETSDDLGTCTAIVYGNKGTATSSGLFAATHIKIHFIKYTDGGEIND